MARHSRLLAPARHSSVHGTTYFRTMSCHAPKLCRDMYLSCHVCRALHFRTMSCHDIIYVDVCRAHMTKYVVITVQDLPTQSLPDIMVSCHVCRAMYAQVCMSLCQICTILPSMSYHACPTMHVLRCMSLHACPIMYVTECMSCYEISTILPCMSRYACRTMYVQICM